MTRRLLSVAASTLLLAGATSACSTQKPQLAYGLSPSDVEQGFIMGVMDGCVIAAETGRTLDQLNPYRIIRDTSRGAAHAPKEGYTAWAPGMGIGIVRIDDGPGGCEVTAHGAPVRNTFGLIVSTLLGRGYVSQPVQALPSSQFAHELVRSANGRTVKVVLQGHDPATASEFSGLTAHVTATMP